MAFFPININSNDDTTNNRNNSRVIINYYYQGRLYFLRHITDVK